LSAILAVAACAAIGVLAWKVSGRRRRNIDPDEVVTVASFNNESEVAEWKMRLEQIGIPSSSFGNNFSRGAARGFLGDVQLGTFALQVNARNAQRAQEILRAEGCKGVV